MSIAAPDQLNYRIFHPSNPSGKAPVVFLHGLMGFAANWGKVWPAFQEERTVLVPDQRGHARSKKPETGYSPTNYAQDLQNLFGQLKLGPAHIVGHSMGGRVALRFVSLFPELSLSLCMEDSGGEARPDRIQWIEGLLGKIPTPFLSRESAKQFFEENFRDDPMTGSFLHANLETKEVGRLDWRFHKPGMVETIRTGRAVDGMEEFRRLTLPTLLIRGGRSTEFSADEAERMASVSSNIELVTIEGAGHYVHAEKPGPFNEALQAFLNRVDEARA
jgi:esterase